MTMRVAYLGALWDTLLVTEVDMKKTPFLDIFLVFLLVALVLADAWDFVFRADHPVSSIVASLLALAALAVGCTHVFQKRVQS